MRSALVCGAGGFIGSHLVKRLKREGVWVRGVDLKFPEFDETYADDFAVGDLRDQAFTRSIIDRRFDEVYQLAADMGGAGYLFTGENDANVMYYSAMINLNVIQALLNRDIRRVFYSSSACIYPAYNQQQADSPNCVEGSAYPAAPDSEYGWEKLFSERLYLAHGRNFGIETRIARYHNIFGPEGTWTGGKEKAPAAMCRKIAPAVNPTAAQIRPDVHAAPGTFSRGPIRAGHGDFPSHMAEGLGAIAVGFWRPVGVMVFVAVLFVGLWDDSPGFRLDLPLFQHERVLGPGPVLDGRKPEPL